MTNILLVDDERLLIHALSRLLRHERYAIYTAEDALEAQYVLKSRPVDLIISDHKMPGMCGGELLSWTAKHFPETIRILLTGWTTIGNLPQTIDYAHIDRLLTKPCDGEKLRSAIQGALQARQTSSIRNNRQMQQVRRIHLRRAESSRPFRHPR